MAWNEIVNPDLAGTPRRRKRLQLTDFGSHTNSRDAWVGSMHTSNTIHQIYRGRQDRLERYHQYDWMDSDSDVARALDIIAEHCTEKNVSGYQFDFDWIIDEPTEEESVVLEEMLNQWNRINKWEEKNRLFKAVRNVLKYGDWFYFRNPHTFELYSIHPKFVLGAVIDRETLEVMGWIIKNFKFNVENLEISIDNQSLNKGLTGNTHTGMGTAAAGFRNTKVIPAIHIVHITMSEGRFSGAASDDDLMDQYNNRWPFGESWLEQIYTTFRDRNLLEQSFLIHRVQRAPTRLAWFLDVGKKRPDQAKWEITNFKNELNQKRVPQTGNGRSMESVYNPISQLEDYFIPVTAEQRGSKVESIEGQPWSDMPDLDHFTKKLMKGLRVPYAWMLGSQEGGSLFNDGRAGVAYQEEIEFSRFCQRLQNNIYGEFDQEFKMYIKWRDVNVNPADFELKLVPPTNYEDSKMAARDQENIGVWSSLKDESYFSKRWLAKRFLKLTDNELIENERYFLEENFPMQAGMDSDGMGGGMGGIDMSMNMGGPPGAGGMGGGMDGLGGEGMEGGMGDMSGGMGGMADAGAGGMGGMGMGESKLRNEPKLRSKTKILNEEIRADDIKPVARKDNTGFDYQTRTPKDNSFLPNDPLKNRKPIAKLSVVKKLRVAHIARRVEDKKRLNIINKIYKRPAETGGMI